MNGIVKQIDGGRLFLEITKEIYEKEAIIASADKFIDKFYINIDSISQDKFRVYFQPKEKIENNLLEGAILEFCNELIDQQLRTNIEKKFGNIRDLIVEQAFSPLKKK